MISKRSSYGRCYNMPQTSGLKPCAFRVQTVHQLYYVNLVPAHLNRVRFNNLQAVFQFYSDRVQVAYSPRSIGIYFNDGWTFIHGFPRFI